MTSDDPRPHDVRPEGLGPEETHLDEPPAGDSTPGSYEGPLFLPPNQSPFDSSTRSAHAALPPPPHLPPDLPPPPLSTVQPVSAEGGGSTGRAWVIAVFVAIAVLPSLCFFVVGFSEDDTATESAAGTVLVLSGIAVVVGAVAAMITWAIARRPAGQGRSFGLSAMLTIAGLWGLATGFLGGMAVSIERHPTWDDA